MLYWYLIKKSTKHLYIKYKDLKYFKYHSYKHFHTDIYYNLNTLPVSKKNQIQFMKTLMKITIYLLFYFP